MATRPFIKYKRWSCSTAIGANNNYSNYYYYYYLEVS